MKVTITTVIQLDQDNALTVETATQRISAEGMTEVTATERGCGETGGLLLKVSRDALERFKAINGITSDEVTRHTGADRVFHEGLQWALRI